MIDTEMRVSGTMKMTDGVENLLRSRCAKRMV